MCKVLTCLEVHSSLVALTFLALATLIDQDSGTDFGSSSEWFTHPS